MATKEEGLVTTAVGSEINITTAISDEGIYDFLADLSNITIADELIFRVKTKVRNTDALRTIYSAFINSDSVSGQPIIASGPIKSEYQYQVTVEHTTGTAIDISWKVSEIA